MARYAIMSLLPRNVRNACIAFDTHPAALDDLLIGALGVEVPLPRVLEGRDLRGGARAVFLGEEDVVILAAVEGRIEIDEVHRLVAHVAAQHVEVVAVEKFVIGHWARL